MNIHPLFKYDQFEDAYKYYISMASKGFGMSPDLYEKISELSAPEIIKASIESIYGSSDNFIDIMNNNIMLNTIKAMEMSIQLLSSSHNISATFYYVDKVYILALRSGFSINPPEEFVEWNKDYKKIVPDYWLELRCKNNKEIWEQIRQGFVEKDFLGYYADNTQSAYIKLTPVLSYNHIMRLINILSTTNKTG